VWQQTGGEVMSCLHSSSLSAAVIDLAFVFAGVVSDDAGPRK